MFNLAPLFIILLALCLLIHTQKFDDQLANASSTSVFATGIGGWEDAFHKAAAFCDQLNETEKTAIATGALGLECAGMITSIPRLNFPGLCLQDGPVGVRTADLVSVFPAGVAAASTWDTNLMYARGFAMGQEFRAKGANAILGPVAAPLGRHPLGGRNWEGFGADPYLSGACMSESVSAIQAAGVQAVAKHFIGNEQETMRTDELVDGQDIPAISSNIDDRTLHELYLWPFANAVKAGVSSIMCSYNRLNDTYACENSRTLNEILKGELAFQGYVMSDWFATHTGVRAINAGLDMDQPGPLNQETAETYSLASLASLPTYFGGNITAAVQNGSVSGARLNDMVHRIMTPYFQLGQDQNYPSPDESGMFAQAAYAGLTSIIPIAFAPPARDVQANHSELIRTIGSESIILLKNTKSTLPLTNEMNIGVFGNDASPVTAGLYLSGNDGDSYTTADGTLAMGGGSGSGRATYVVSPLEALMQKAVTTKARIQYITDNDLIATSKLYSIFPIPQVCLVFLKTWAEESEDRASFELDWNSTQVVNNVAAMCPNTIVITNSAGVNTMPWADNPNVTAILAAHYLGQESGNAIVDVLYGAKNPSGHLPYTIPREASDYDFPVVNATDSDNPQSNFTEGLLIDYRHFDANDITPLFEFGFGLSYTTFNLSGPLSVTISDEELSLTPPSSPVMPGGNPALWSTIVTVSGNVTNVGSVIGSSVPQLYISYENAPPNTPRQVLRGFNKINLLPGQTSQFGMDLMRRDLSFWNVELQDWQIPTGTITLNVGFSSRDLRLQHNLTLITSE